MNFTNLGGEAPVAPALVLLVEFDAVVQAFFAPLPEFDAGGRDGIASPIGWPGHFLIFTIALAVFLKFLLVIRRDILLVV